MSASVVNVFTEWGRLEEVIVGEVHNGYVPKDPGDADLSYRLFYGANLPQGRVVDGQAAHGPGLRPETISPYVDRVVQERREDVEQLVVVLEQLGVTVKRPQRLAAIAPVATPDWSSLTHFAHNVRDQTLVVGDDIIETPPLCRHRYFENDLLKQLFQGYFRGGAKWTVAPRPLMRDASFDRGDGEGGDEIEMMFDAAQCLRFGTDIVINVSTEHHRLGARWLQRHLGERFTVHVVDGVAADHIDATMMPLRPGLLFVNPRTLDGKLDRLPLALRGWDTISVCDTDETVYEDGELLLASENISANVLAIGDDRVLINARCTNTIRALELRGLTPIPVELRHSRLYGGGFHCITLDMRRAERLETYF
ncbi:MAG: glycine amidinotransferase [Solirubrobacteraceae bacterium]|nr:glycine amidinotransferase [Solirubrobacteraceae bacterium]